MSAWEWALAFPPAATDGGADPATVPLGDVLGASIRYGKTGDALAYSGGSMSLTVDNRSGAYTPSGGGTYSTARFLGVEVSLTADVTGAGAPTWTHGPPAAFTGVVTAVSWRYQSSHEATMEVEVSDMLTMLGTLSFASVDASAGLDISAGSAEAALTAVLTAANGVTSQIGQVTVLNPSGDAGESLMALTDYSGTAGGLIRTIEQSDGGDVFVRHGLPVAAAPLAYNALTFRTRGQQPITSAVTSVTGLEPLNLWDASLTPSGTDPRPFASANFVSGSAIAYSQASFARTGGAPQLASAPTAELDEFGARTIDRTGLLTASDLRVLSVATAFLRQYGVELAPPLAARAIRLPTIVTGENDGWQLVKTSVGDACTLRFQPGDAPNVITISGIVSGIVWQITPGGATLTVELEDGDQSVAFILDSSQFGRLDVNRLG